MTEGTTITLVLEKLTDLLVSSAKQFGSSKDKVESVKNDLEFFKGFLTEVSKKPIEDEATRELVKQIRMTVFEAEDIVDEYVLEFTKYKPRHMLHRFSHRSSHPAKILDLAQKMEHIKAKMNDVYTRTNSEGSNSKRIIQAPVVEGDIVGIEDEAERVITLLITGSEELEVIAITGMLGIGKTTLAQKIFYDPKIEFEFYNRIWVHVSPQCDRKKVFLTILSRITTVTDQMRFNMTEEDLSEKIRRYLSSEKYLVVMDDVWTRNDWDSLKIAFPWNEKRSRILLTTRDEDLAKYANPKADPLKLRFLTSEESWTLLKRKTLGFEFPEPLIHYGKLIADKCQGLPLSITVIGGILLEIGTEISGWEDVSKNVEKYIVNMDRQGTMENFIEWSFNYLPYDLKACLVYFGMFPEGFRIPVVKLVRLWIAEGFIQQRGEVNLEDTAEDYLEHLVNRNLVIVGKRSSNGRIKTCFVNNMIHAFCKTKAQDNFYYQINQSNQITDAASDYDFRTCRGLSIPPHLLNNNISPRQFGSHVRSFLCLSSSSEEIELPLANISAIPKTFRLLRVLDGEPIRFIRFPLDLLRLANLRYLVLCIRFRIIPKYITSLWNMQTLIVKTSLNTLDIKGEMCKMSRLRHLETNASTSMILTPADNGESEEDSLRNLRTLSSVSPETCTEDIVIRAPNLNKLGIRGQLAKLFEENCGRSLFDNVYRLNFLENLKLFHEGLLDVYDRGDLRLPDRFPPNLKKLTLHSTHLDWENMHTLGRLGKLEILKLKENAFKGKWWETRDGDFPALRVLHIETTDLAIWEASAHHFPRLESLHLRHCTYLMELPSDLAYISSLKEIDLYWTTISAAASAKQIQEDQRDSIGKGFRLSISPPDHVR